MHLQKTGMEWGNTTAFSRVLYGSMATICLLDMIGHLFQENKVFVERVEKGMEPHSTRFMVHVKMSNLPLLIC